jgi:hypothetical protein
VQRAGELNSPAATDYSREVPDLNIAEVGDKILIIVIQHFWPDND